MGLFSSLYTGATGMQAQSQATAAVSTNIANSTTTGYKKSDIAFHELVLSQSRGPAPSEVRGAVTTERILRADVQGGITATSSTTDAAVLGNGLFPVKTNTDLSTPFLYTRNGTFSEDAQGLLRNSAGFILYGWQFDENGDLPGNLADAGSLTPIDVDLFETQPIPTSLIELSMNLDANQSIIDPHALTTPQELPVSSQPAHFSRTFNIFDTLGAERQVSMEFRRTVGPMAHFTSGLTAPITTTSDLVGGLATPGIAANDVLQISDGTNTLDVTFVNAPADTSINEAATGQDLLDVINNFTNLGGTQVFDAELTAENRLLVRAIDPTVSLDISGSDASVTGANGFNFIPDPGDNDLIYDPEASLAADGAGNPNQTSFPAFADTTSPNPRFWWEIRLTTTDPADPVNGAPVEISKGLINFDGNGTLNAVPDANGDVRINLGSVNFDDASTAEDIGALSIDITRFSQFGGQFTVINANQNGAGVGLRDRIEITQDGLIVGKFTNGEQRALYKIPLAVFTNANGLNDLSGTVFEETGDSGSPIFAEAGTNGAGSFRPSSIESSNVDIADEFGTLIVSQRGFSANSQVFQSVNEMTQTLARLKG